MFISKESEAESIKKYQELEKEITQLIRAGESKFQISKVSSPVIVEVVKHAWDLQVMKRVMAEQTLDIERLPLGRL
jgi:hypothetical protein